MTPKNSSLPNTTSLTWKARKSLPDWAGPLRKPLRVYHLLFFSRLLQVGGRVMQDGSFRKPLPPPTQVFSYDLRVEFREFVGFAFEIPAEGSVLDQLLPHFLEKADPAVAFRGNGPHDVHP